MTDSILRRFFVARHKGCRCASGSSFMSLIRKPGTLGGFVTAMDLAKRTDILPGLRQVHWDIVIVDEAHRMSWTPPARKTARYALGELLRDTADHLLLLTATPHKGAPSISAYFCNCWIPMPTPMCALYRRPWTAGAPRSMSAARRKRWSTFPRSSRTARGLRARYSRNEFRTRSVST